MTLAARVEKLEHRAGIAPLYVVFRQDDETEGDALARAGVRAEDDGAQVIIVRWED